MKLSRDRNSFTVLELLVVMAILVLLLGLLLAAIQKVRDAATRLRCQNQMRQLGLALHQYHDAHSGFPSGVRHFVLIPGVGGSTNADPEPYPLMTWHTRLLPFIEQDALWRQTEQAYASDRYLLANPPHTARSVSVSLFLCPADSTRSASVPTSEPRPALTSYLGVSGVSHLRSSGVLFLDSQIRITNVLDGTSQTLLLGERPPSANGGQGRWYGGWGNWGSTDSFLGVRETFRDDGAPLCSPGPYLFQPGRVDDPCAAFHYWSLHSNGANFLFVDGSVKFITYSAAELLPALATRADREIVTIP